MRSLKSFTLLRRAAPGKFQEVRFDRQAVDLSAVTSLRRLRWRTARGAISSLGCGLERSDLSWTLAQSKSCSNPVSLLSQILGDIVLSSIDVGSLTS